MTTILICVIHSISQRVLLHNQKRMSVSRGETRPRIMLQDSRLQSLHIKPIVKYYGAVEGGKRTHTTAMTITRTHRDRHSRLRFLACNAKPISVWQALFHKDAVLPTSAPGSAPRTALPPSRSPHARQRQRERSTGRWINHFSHSAPHLI